METSHAKNDELPHVVKLPNGWTQRRLHECAGVNGAQLGGGTDPDFQLEYLDIAAIERTGVIGDSRPYRFDDAPSRARRLAGDGDILVSTVRPYLRKFGRIWNAPDNLVVSTGYAVIRPNDDVDGDFLYQHILSVEFVEFLKRRMTGSNYPAVTAADVESYPLPLPPLAQQYKIGAILRSFDDAAERTYAIIEQIQVVKRGLMQQLFMRGLNNTTLRNTVIGKLPNDWMVVPLVEACEAPGQYGANVPKSDFQSGGIRYIRITDINDDGTLKEGAVGINVKSAKKYVLRTDDLLFARSGTVGKSYLHTLRDVRCAFAGYLIRFRTKPNLLLPTFLKEWVSTAFYWRWVAETQRVQAQPNINATEYGQLPVPLPPLREQQAIVQVAEALNRAVRINKMQLIRLEKLKRSLLSVLLTGKLCVTSPIEQMAHERGEYGP